MGGTSPTVAPGAAALSKPLAVASVQPTITIGGSSIFVLWAGLAPKQVGVYQINALVPFHGILLGPVTSHVQDGKAAHPSRFCLRSPGVRIDVPYAMRALLVFAKLLPFRPSHRWRRLRFSCRSRETGSSSRSTDHRSFGSATSCGRRETKHTVSVQTIEYWESSENRYQFNGWTNQRASSSELGAHDADRDGRSQRAVSGCQTSAPLTRWMSYSSVVLQKELPASPPGIICGIADANLAPNYPPSNLPDPSSPCPPLPYTVETTSAYVPAGMSINLLVQPNPSYIFTGWLTSPSSGNNVQAFANTYTINGPLSIYPQSRLSRPILTLGSQRLREAFRSWRTTLPSVLLRVWNGEPAQFMP